jgi:hypothetical protein
MKLYLTMILLFSMMLSGCITFGKVNTGVQENGHFESPHLKRN